MLLHSYPKISKTYMINEAEAVRKDYEIKIITNRRPSDDFCINAPPYERCGHNINRLGEMVEEFRPQVLHTHYLEKAGLLARLGRKYGVPFTIRTHSMDTLLYQKQKLPSFKRFKLLFRNRFRQIVRHANSEYCLGLLILPFARPLLENAGFRGDKLIDCYPAIDYQRFYDRSPNGDAILNQGACLPKKNMGDFIELGKHVDKSCNLYGVSYDIDKLKQRNREQGSPVNIYDAVQPEEMPAVYKRHGWLVYTGCFREKTVGWSMAVAEAQASGLGVCFPNLRPDVKEYLGGAGFLYDSIREVPKIISQPYPDEMREIGFEQAKKSDIENHKHLLTDLWDRAAGKI